MVNLDSLQLISNLKNIIVNTNRLDDQIKDKTIKIQHFNIKLVWLRINPNPRLIQPQLHHDQHQITLISYENIMINDHKYQNKNQN